MTPDIFTIRKSVKELDDTFTLHLAPVDGSDCDEFAPGQFNMLYAFGGSEVPISFSGAASRKDEWVHTVRSVGAATIKLGQLKSGDSLGVRGPFGRGWPLDQAEGKDLLLIAGGLGLAPLRPVILEYIAGKCKAKSLSLFYGARSPDDLLYQDDFKAWKKHIKLRHIVDHAGLDWQGRVGVVTSLIANANLDPGNTLVFICGPEVMMRFSIQQLQIRGIGDDRLYLSMERNMKCATGHCGHCQWGPTFICKDGPVFEYKKVKTWFQIREL